MLLNRIKTLLQINDNDELIYEIAEITKEKILNYIPTKSSVRFMDEYMQAVFGKKEHATLLVGPYGKGKSHLLLVLLAVLSLERNSENEKIINQLKAKLKGVEELPAEESSEESGAREPSTQEDLTNYDKMERLAKKVVQESTSDEDSDLYKLYNTYWWIKNRMKNFHKWLKIFVGLNI